MYSSKKNRQSGIKHTICGGGGSDEPVPQTNAPAPDAPAPSEADKATVQVDPSQQTVDVKDITKSEENNPPTTNKITYMDPSRVTLYNIPAGTELFHGSVDVATFDPLRINLGANSLVAYFTPNKNFATSYIKDCMPGSKGYVHKFITNQQIDKIFIMSPHNKELKWTEADIEDKFCNNPDYGQRLNGIGFFIVDKNKENIQDTLFSSEFALCDPEKYLTYIGTMTCLGPRSLSEEYRFDK